MIFSEVYSVYFQTVAQVLKEAMRPDVAEKSLRQVVQENAFQESVLTILPALKDGTWPLMRQDMTSALAHAPVFLMTLLEKRWLKALTDDPRLKLFGIEFPELAEVKPLFTSEDYCLYDQFANGDPFEDAAYIRHFQTLLAAAKEKRPVRIAFENRRGEQVFSRFYVKTLEYSLKDDRIRILTEKCRFPVINLQSVRSCEFYTEAGEWEQKVQKDQEKRSLTLIITDRRNAMQRAMYHFSHFEKQAQKLDDQTYELKLFYPAADEKEMIIRVLAFGPFLRVAAPESFVNLVRQRLISQKTRQS